MAAKNKGFNKGQTLFYVSILVIAMAIFFGLKRFFYTPEIINLGDVDITTKQQGLQIDPILDSYIFGEKIEQVAQVSNAPAEPSIQVEAVNVEVTGILASNSDIFARATLKVQGKREQSYNIGDNLTATGRVVIAAITNEGIIVDNNGEEQEYIMKKALLESGKNPDGSSGTIGLFDSDGNSINQELEDEVTRFEGSDSNFSVDNFPVGNNYSSDVPFDNSNNSFNNTYPTDEEIANINTSNNNNQQPENTRPPGMENFPVEAQFNENNFQEIQREDIDFEDLPEELEFEELN